MAQIKRQTCLGTILLLIGLTACNLFRPLDQRLVSDDEKIRLKASEKMVRLSPEKSAELAQKLTAYLHNSDGRVVNRAADALVLLGTSAIDSLRKALADPDVYVRLTAAAALGRMGREARTALPELTVCLTDMHPLVREEAANALGQMGSDGNPAADSLLQALKDPNTDVRTASAEALKKMGIKPPAGLKSHPRIS